MIDRLWNEIVETIYGAAPEPDRWPEVLQRIAETVGARGGTLLFHRGDGRIGTIVSPSLTGIVVDYDRDWQHRDVRAARAFAASASGRRDVQTDQMHFNEEEIRTLPIYRDFLAPRGLRWSMGVAVSPVPDVAVVLTVIRAIDTAPFDEAEQEHFVALSRHVERSLSLSIRLMDAQTERLGFAWALDRIACGALVLDARQRILFANRTARAMLGHGLTDAGGQLRVRDPQGQFAFAARFAALAGSGDGACEALIVPNGDASLIVQILPVRLDGEAAALSSAAAVVLVSAPDEKRPYDAAVLRDAFRLTLGEARLAALIGAGRSPSEAAETLGIAESTVRTVLKRVFEKTGVSRQNELAALLGRLFLRRAPQPDAKG